jgi:hypothetical protein
VEILVNSIACSHDPGQASHQPPSFPDAWCGLWKDSYGKLMFLKRLVGRQLLVSIAPGHERPFFPLPDLIYSSTHRLSGLYQHDPHGQLFLRVDAGEPGLGPYFEVEFIYGEGDRLRPAEPTDPATGVIARPRVNHGPGGEQNERGISWALPLSNFWRVPEEEARFWAYHGGERD